MTMRTRFVLTCACGHTGSVNMSENDTPYSASWESYSLEGFDGGTLNKEGAAAGWAEVFAHLRPVCPMCKSRLTEADLSKDA